MFVPLVECCVWCTSCFLKDDVFCFVDVVRRFDAVDDALLVIQVVLWCVRCPSFHAVLYDVVAFTFCVVVNGVVDRCGALDYDVVRLRKVFVVVSVYSLCCCCVSPGC